MFCINCFHKKTTVSNSRPHKKTAQIWRRRACEKCGQAFTTYERPALHEELTVYNSRTRQMFNPGRLYTDILECITPQDLARYDDAFWLSQTIEERIILVGEKIITTGQIKEIVYEALKNYDQVASIQYAAKHGMNNKLRRGRPKKA